MTLVEPSQSDLDVILPRWAKRCGPEYAANWNKTVGKVLALKAKAK